MKQSCEKAAFRAGFHNLFTLSSQEFCIIFSMKIYDIPQASKITINLVHNNESRTVETTVLTRYGEGVLITPVQVDGQLIDFCDRAHFEYVESYTNIKHIFQVDDITKVDFSGSEFHVVNGKEVISSSNRRRAERYETEVMCSAVINDTTRISAVLTDISMRGFSLMVGYFYGLSVGDKIRIEFFKDFKSIKIVIEGVVVRNFFIDGNLAAGCAIEHIDPRGMAFVLERKKAHQEGLDKTEKSKKAEVVTI